MNFYPYQNLVPDYSHDAAHLFWHTTTWFLTSRCLLPKDIFSLCLFNEKGIFIFFVSNGNQIQSHEFMGSFHCRVWNFTSIKHYKSFSLDVLTCDSKLVSTKGYRFSKPLFLWRPLFFTWHDRQSFPNMNHGKKYVCPNKEGNVGCCQSSLWVCAQVIVTLFSMTLKSSRYLTRSGHDTQKWQKPSIEFLLGALLPARSKSNL